MELDHKHHILKIMAYKQAMSLTMLCIASKQVIYYAHCQYKQWSKLMAMPIVSITSHNKVKFDTSKNFYCISKAIQHVKQAFNDSEVISLTFKNCSLDICKLIIQQAKKKQKKYKLLDNGFISHWQ